MPVSPVNKVRNSHFRSLRIVDINPAAAGFEHRRFTKDHKGEFLFANNPDAAARNERNLIQIYRPNSDRFAHVEQITGAIARRIECWVKPGQELKAGQLIGLVRFGSQVAVYLPKNAVRVMVKEGQKVQGGNTVLALWK